MEKVVKKLLLFGLDSVDLEWRVAAGVLTSMFFVLAVFDLNDLGEFSHKLMFKSSPLAPNGRKHHPEGKRRQHVHFIPIVGVGKRGAYYFFKEKSECT